MRPFIASNGVPYLQIRSVGPPNTLGWAKEGKDRILIICYVALLNLVQCQHKFYFETFVNISAVIFKVIFITLKDDRVFFLTKTVALLAIERAILTCVASNISL